MNIKTVALLLMLGLAGTLVLSSHKSFSAENKDANRYTSLQERTVTNEIPVTCFDRCNLPANATLTYLVNPTTKSMRIIGGKTASDSLKFYCEQAIWDSFIQIEVKNRPISPFTTTFSTYPSPIPQHKTIEEVYLQKHQDQKGLVVVDRLIPLAAAKLFPNVITENEVNSLPNLVGLKVSQLQSEKLEEYREDWFRYIKRVNSSLARGGINYEAAKLRKKYQVLFVDKLAKG